MSQNNSSFNKELCKKDALAFFDTAVLIDEAPRDSEFLNEMLCPYTVNLMFSCELFLKYLYYYSCSRTVKGHNIKCLYCELCDIAPLIAEKIEKEYYNNVGENGDDPKLFKLDRVLSMCKNNFEDFRYLHEGKKGTYEMHTTCMFAFASALKEVSKEY